jgi:hypothetical protein
LVDPSDKTASLIKMPNYADTSASGITRRRQQLALAALNTPYVQRGVMDSSIRIIRQQGQQDIKQGPSVVTPVESEGCCQPLG